MPKRALETNSTFETLSSSTTTSLGSAPNAVTT
jgi:hypothetical protein